MLVIVSYYRVTVETKSCALQIGSLLGRIVRKVHEHLSRRCRARLFDISVMIDKFRVSKYDLFGIIEYRFLTNNSSWKLQMFLGKIVYNVSSEAPIRIHKTLCKIVFPILQMSLFSSSGKTYFSQEMTRRWYVKWLLMKKMKTHLIHT